MKRLVLKIIFGACAIGQLFSQGYAVDDLLKDAFQPALLNEQVIYIWDDKTSVGNTIFQWSTAVDVSIENGVTFWNQDSTIVRITKLLLRFTLIASVSFMIWSWISYVGAANSESWHEKARQKIYNIIIGIIIALSSVSIIYLLESVSTSSLRDSGELSGVVETFIS